jgi:hypothetical protein
MNSSLHRPAAHAWWRTDAAPVQVCGLSDRADAETAESGIASVPPGTALFTNSFIEQALPR